MESDGDENVEHETVIISGDYEEDFDTPTHLTVVHAQELIDGVGHGSPEITMRQAAKSKYYKQTYRTAWEHMPDFKGWLRGVPGQPTRAFCIYCQKTLHAHRLSLLKHTCTMRHQKAAQIHNARKTTQQKNFEILVQSTTEGETEHIEEHVEEDQTMEEESYLAEEQEEHEEEEEEEENIHITTIKKERKPFQVSPSKTSSPISTHVLDTARGVPVHGLLVSLYKLIDGRWTYINEGNTNIEGRFSQFVDRNDFSAGRYKMHYDVDRYFEMKKQDTIYPFIEIVFDVPTEHDSFHIPLLLSPFGYTTYRGS